MHQSLLHRRVQRFRSVAYLWLAGLLLLLSIASDAPIPAWCGACVFPTLPSLLQRLDRIERAFGIAARDVENVLTPLAIAWVSLPVLPSVAVFGALLTGVVALAGWRSAPLGAVQAIAGWSIGHWLAPTVHYAASRWVDVASVAFIVAYTTPLCALGYEQTIRLHRSREELRRASDELERQRDRLSRYVAGPVVVRAVCDPPRALERRWLTVAFVDLSDFTALTERLEPEDLTALLDAFFGALADLTARHRGTLHKFLGDGALISFGEARSDGRQADARACIDMLDRLAKLVDALNAAARERAIDAVLAVRAGVASGYCSIGDFGAAERIEYTMIGPAVNLASRLESLAAAGEVWVSQTTRDLVGAARFDALGEFVVKGVTDPIAAFRLRGASVDATVTAL
jgi:class 3 adenylate cyclase